jgi:hypothetical protein
MLDTIQLDFGNGISRTWWFNLYAYPELAKLTDVDAMRAIGEIMAIAKENVTIALSMVVYSGLAGYQLSQGNRKFDFTYPEICTWMATAEDTQVLQCWESFKKVTGISDILAKITEGNQLPDDKKKTKKQ